MSSQAEGREGKEAYGDGHKEKGAHNVMAARAISGQRAHGLPEGEDEGQQQKPLVCSLSLRRGVRAKVFTSVSGRAHAGGTRTWPVSKADGGR